MNLLIMASHLLITWTEVQDMCMAVMEMLASPLWQIWNLLWFVLSHGWSLAIAVAAGTAVAVVIRHRRSGSSSPGTENKTLAPAAVIISEIFKVVQVHPRNGWSLTAVEHSLRVFLRFFPILSHPTGSPVLATTSVIDMPPKRALQLAVSTKDLLCWLPGTMAPVQTIRKPQNPHDKFSHDDGDVVRLTIKWTQMHHPIVHWLWRVKKMVYWLIEKCLPFLASLMSPPVDFVTEAMERTWQCREDESCSLLLVPQHSTLLPYHWSLLVFMPVPDQKDMSLAAVFAFPKGDLNVTINHSVSQLCALREHAFMKELRVYNSAPSSHNHTISTRKHSFSVDPPTVPPIPLSTANKDNGNQPLSFATPSPITTPTLTRPVLSESDRLYQEKAEECATQLVKIARATERDGWVSLGVSKNVAIMKKLAKSGDPPSSCVKGALDIDVPPDFALRVLMDSTHACELDDMLKDIELIHTISDTMHIRHLHYKAVWPTTGRDFAVLDVVGRIDESTSVHGAISIVDPRIPEEKGYVRGEVLAGGYVVEAIPGHPKRAHITYITQVDLKGSVPTFVVNKITEGQPMCALQMRRIAEREYSKATSNPLIMQELEEKLPIYFIMSDSSPPQEPSSSLSATSSGGATAAQVTTDNTAGSYPLETHHRDTSPHSYHDSHSSSTSSSPVIDFDQDAPHTTNQIPNEHEAIATEEDFVASSSLPMSSLLDKLPRYSTADADEMRSSSASQLEASLEYPRRDNQIDYRTLGNQAAAQLLEELFHISGLKLYDPETYKDQSNDWRFDGIEKDVVVLKRKSPESPFYSFVGKGIIGLPPQEVFNTVRNPNQRFIFDNMLKELHIVKQVEEGLYILHLHHETTQCFLKQSRDFCLLVCERSEPNKKLLVGTSIDIPECPPQLNITRGKIMSSGWVIEPYKRNGKLCTEVTYMVQIDIGGLPATLVNFVSRRQPLAVAYLRDYLESTTVGSYNAAQPEEKLSPSWDPVLFRK